MLKVCVGKASNTSTFFVHERLFTSRAESFKRTASSVWQSDEDHTIALPNDDPDIFNLYAHLVYTGKLATKGPKEYSCLCDLYVLAEKLEDTASKNCIVDGMHGLFHEILSRTASSTAVPQILPVGATRRLYDDISNGSPARRLVVDFHAEHGDATWLRTEKTLLPAEFLYDIAVRLLQKRTSNVFGALLSRSSSEYHELDKKVPEVKDVTLEGVLDARSTKAEATAWHDGSVTHYCESTPKRSSDVGSASVGDSAQNTTCATRIDKATVKGAWNAKSTSTEDATKTAELATPKAKSKAVPAPAGETKKPVGFAIRFNRADAKGTSYTVLNGGRGVETLSAADAKFLANVNKRISAKLSKLDLGNKEISDTSVE